LKRFLRLHGSRGSIADWLALRGARTWSRPWCEDTGRAAKDGRVVKDLSGLLI
jgi:hypothetical protein